MILAHLPVCSWLLKVGFGHGTLICRSRTFINLASSCWPGSGLPKVVVGSVLERRAQRILNDLEEASNDFSRPMRFDSSPRKIWRMPRPKRSAQD